MLNRAAAGVNNYCEPCYKYKNNNSMDPFDVLQLILMFFLGIAIIIMLATCMRALFLAFYQNFLEQSPHSRCIPTDNMNTTPTTTSPHHLII